MSQDTITLGGGATAVAPGRYSAWVKNLSLDKELRLSEFSLHEKFKHVANIVEDTVESRQTVIRFDPVIPASEWARNTEWIYIFTIDDRIVKIGGTRDSLKGRAGSYLCGHHIPERGKSRDCSKTNGFVYNTFDDYIRNGHTIQMWGCEIPAVEATVDIWGTQKTIRTQVYTAYETHALETYRKETGHYPELSDNSDPTHRKQEAKTEKMKKATKPRARKAPAKKTK